METIFLFEERPAQTGQSMPCMACGRPAGGDPCRMVQPLRRGDLQEGQAAVHSVLQTRVRRVDESPCVTCASM